MPASQEFADYLVELLTPLGRVTARRMFGGFGLYLDGLTFAIIVDDQLWLKADADNRAAFEALDLPPFTYQRQGKTATMSYYRAPDDALEAPALLLPWARNAYAAALRAAAHKTRAKNTGNPD